MEMKWNKKLSSFVLCIVLTVAIALSATGCNGNQNKETASTSEAQTTSQTESNVLGEGSTEFAFIVVDADGNETEFEIHTDAETVGEALVELDLIEGDEGEYGLYVTSVNGVTADYDKDGVYWAFYVNDEYASAGVDSTPITEGESYSFKIEKA